MGSTKHITKPQFVNKTHEVYHYIVENPGKNEKEILHALSHLTAPVVHASFKMLAEGGYVSKKETSELNKLNRRICEFRADTGKAYTPTYSRQKRSKEAGKPPFTIRPHWTSEEPRGLSDTGGMEMLLTFPTKNGPVQLSLGEAQGIYRELKKIFACLVAFGGMQMAVKNLMSGVLIC